MKKIALIAFLLFPLVSQARVRATGSVLADRMDRFSARLLSAPYIVDPLGEGETGEFDRDPRYRLDGFDCTTFVETVIATAKAHSKKAILPNMDKIRYKNGKVRFETRNHMPGLDWIQNNVKNGTLTDITSSIDSTSTYMAEALIERDEWYRFLDPSRLSGVPENEKAEKIRLLRSKGTLVGKEVERVPFLHKKRIDANPKILLRIPHGSVINIVRPNWNLKNTIGTNFNISHQGLAFHKNGIVYFRHASVSKEVMEEPLIDYVRKTLPSPTIQGINVLAVR